VTAIDATDPKAPHVVSQVQVTSHGMSVSDDGNRAYIADPTGQNMLILDTSDIQARKPGAQAREISRITWDKASIPQNAIPFTEGGHPYVLEFDEYTAGSLHNGSGDDIGAGRIIDIADEKAPKIVANLRLQINQPADHKKYGGDPGADGQVNGGVQGYAAHYCNIPTRVDPTLVACSFIASGLRLFDISKITAPREVGYFVAPTKGKFENSNSPSDYAMSMPTFASARNEIWWTDGTSGFYVLRIATAAVPPLAVIHRTTTPKKCVSVRRFTIHPYHPNGDPLRSARITVDGRHVKTHGRGRKLYAVVDLRGFRKRTVTVRIAGTTRSGKAVRDTRHYHTCRPGH
jgi:hypothetical protein